MSVYRKTFEVGWADVDPNNHMRNSAYLDFCTHVRFSYAAQQGLTWDRFAALGVGPVILSEELKYLREVRMGETIHVDYMLAGISPDGARWRLRHTLTKSNDERAAVIEARGGWLHLAERKLIIPPDAVAGFLLELHRTDDFAELPNLDPR
jgi:acyl-CoA thioester hydrolase